MEVDSRDRHSGSLQSVFSEIRKQIINNISLNLPKGSLALGPVLFFIEDPEQKCLYNWTNVRWQELKLGNLFKGVLRDIKDVSNYCSKNKFGTSINNKFSVIHSKCNDYLDAETEDYFDNWPVFKDKHGDFAEFVATIENLFKQIPQRDIDDIEELDISQIAVQRLPIVLDDIFKINEGRYYALAELRTVITEYPDRLDAIGAVIAKHPRYRNFSEGEDAKERWFAFTRDIKTFDETNFEAAKKSYPILMSKAIDIFCDLPQEVSSSNSLSELKKINTEMHLKRSDTIAIRLSELSYQPFPARFSLNHIKQNYVLYSITHYFERLFYIGSDQRTHDKSEIKNIIILPIKFIDAQVIGQIVVISPEPISRQLVINSVEAFLHKIRDAAATDFESEIFSQAIEDATERKTIINETTYILMNLKKLFTYEGIVLCKFNYGTDAWSIDKITAPNCREGIDNDAFIKWLTINIEIMGEQKYRVPVDQESNSVLSKLSKQPPSSSFIGLLETKSDKYALILYFNENPEVMVRSASEVYLPISQVLEKIALIKERQLIDRDKLAIVHNGPKEITKIQDALKDIKEKLHDPALISRVEQALFIADGYHMELLAVIKDSYEEYRETEKERYNVSDRLHEIARTFILKDSYIEAIKQKISCGYGLPEYGTTLMNLWNAHKNHHRSFIQIRSDNDSMITNVNKFGLYFLIDALIKNALDHTDWDYFRDNGSDSLVILDCRKTNHAVAISIANIPKDKNFISHFYEMFYGSSATPHLRMIGKIYAAASGQGEDKIICRKYDDKYISMMLKIPLEAEI